MKVGDSGDRVSLILNNSTRST